MFSIFRACKAPVVRVFVRQIKGKQIYRTFVNKEPNSSKEKNRHFWQSIKEYIMGPATETPFSIGKGALAAGAVYGIGSLCYYGLGMSDEEGAIDKSILWPPYVKQRIQLTYIYFVTAITLTAISCSIFFQFPALVNIVQRNNFLGIITSLFAIIGTGVITQHIDYAPGLSKKHLAWVFHTCVVGYVLAPMCYVGGHTWFWATWYAWFICGALSLTAICAPSEQYLKLSGPIGMGLSVVLASGIGTWFLPQSTVIGANMFAVFLYGGILFFSGFLFHDMQRIIARAESYPLDPPPGVPPYDPINQGMQMYMDMFNIFFRLVTLTDLNDIIDNIAEEIWKPK